jgi:hypothetical protein
MAISTIGASALDSGVSQLGKNLIHNGAMTVAQRGATITSPADLAYTLDGWQTRDNVGATITVSQDTTGIFAGIGGSPTCMKIDCTGAEASVAAGEFYVIRQKIETQNCDFLNYGESNALPVTLSFNIQSPKSGTHTGVLGNNAASPRSYAFNFTVASADTPERVSVTIPGDTGPSAIGQGATTEGLRLNIPLLCGADNAKAAGSWGNSIYEAASNTPNLLDNVANNIYLGDVQLEVGSVATDFEHEDYGETLRKCQRYLEIAGGEADAFLAVAQCRTTTAADAVFRFQVKKRAAPTATVTNATSFIVQQAGGGGQAVTALSASIIDPYGCRFDITVAANLVAGNATLLRTNSAAQKITFSAEL